MLKLSQSEARYGDPYSCLWPDNFHLDNFLVDSSPNPPPHWDNSHLNASHPWQFPSRQITTMTITSMMTSISNQKIWSHPEENFLRGNFPWRLVWEKGDGGKFSKNHFHHLVCQVRILIFMLTWNAHSLCLGVNMHEQTAKWYLTVLSRKGLVTWKRNNGWFHVKSIKKQENSQNSIKTRSNIDHFAL